MLRVENVETAGWEPAIRGMRNPLNSWNRCDTDFNRFTADPPAIGGHDEGLMRRLIGQGSPDHCKFRRMLKIYADVTAPQYWWSEYDTYKVATVANSCSKMHTLMSKPFDLSMFSCEDFAEVKRSPHGTAYVPVEPASILIEYLNDMRDAYFAARDEGDEETAKHLWRRILQLLPQGWMQRRTVELNYEVMANIYRARRHHKLQEWHDFIDAMVGELPYPWIFTGEGC